MLDAITVKEWLLIYFVILAGIGVGNIVLLLKVKAVAERLLYDNELVQYLKAGGRHEN